MASSSDGRALAFPMSLGDNCAQLATRGPEVLLDEEIVAQIAGGDSTCLYLLFDRYSRLVFNIAFNVLHDRGEAEEMVQEVFFYIYRKANLFDLARGQVRTWIAQLGYHLALDRRAYLGRRGFYAGTHTEALADSLVGAMDLEREIGAKLNRVQLQKAFQTLSGTQRRTLELYYFEGLDLREISDKLNEPLGNVRHYYYRGLERLRRSGIVRKLREK